MPGTWYAQDDKIYVTIDGKEDVYPTNWDQMRREEELKEKQKKIENKAVIKENIALKREKESKKRSGRGC